MALLNPSFEDEGDAPGKAEHWALHAVTARQRIAGFGPEPHQAWEDFERWFEPSFAFGPGELALCVFGPHGHGYEAFEVGWSNDPYLTELPVGQMVTASFGPDDVEDMEEGWSNVPYETDWEDVSSLPALFDSEPREDFEEGWRSNETYAWAWADITSEHAAFDGGTTTAEDFENDWPLATGI